MKTKALDGNSKFLRMVLCAMLTFLAWSGANAQSNQGALVGTVSDSSGATIADADVRARNVESGTTYTAKTTSAGNYNIRNVNIGPYDITVTATGFSTTTEKGAVVQVATTTTVNVSLRVGAAADTVTVSADAPKVETETSDIGNVVTTKQILELPLALGGVGALRSPEAFVFLTPGVVGPGTGGSNGSGTNGGVFESKISGGQNYATEILLDGASTYRSENGSSFDEAGPSVEALGEFKVITSTLPAEFGRTTGGIETFSTKAGTNDYHGHLYDIFRNEALNANTWFDNLQLSRTTGSARRNFQRPLDRRNDYGGTFGGPVIIPKFYNGKDKTFFFFSWEQFRQTQGGTTTSTVPTVAERNGDFSALEDLTSNLGINPCDGSIIHIGQVFDPATTRSVNGTPCRTAFPGNVVPSARFNKIGLNILSFYPIPLDSGAVNNYSLSASFPVLNTTMTIRGDQNISAKQKVYFTYSSRQNSRQSTGNNKFNNAAGAGRTQVFTTHYIRTGWDYAISPTLLNHFNIGYNRTNSLNVGGATRFGGGDWDAKLGLTNASGRTFPNINVFEGPTTGLGDNVDGDTVDNGYRLNDNVTLVKGQHTLQFGVDLRYQVYFPGKLDGTSGAIDFGRTQTAATVLTSGQSGNAIASLLLGTPNFGTLAQYSNQPKYLQDYYALFLQDTYKLLPTLTLNLGMRWEVDTPRREAHGNTSNISLTTPNSGAGGLPGALVFAGKGAGRNGKVDETWASTWYKDFAPRVGFAWTPAMYDGKTSIRGGYGIYYGGLGYADFGGFLRQGFTANPQFRTLDNFSPAFNIDTGFPSYAKAPNVDPTQSNFTGPQFVDTSYGRPAMVQNWSLEVQQELATDLIFSLGYVGEHATHLRSNFNGVNNLNPRSFALGPLLSAPFDSPQAIAAGIASPYPGFVGNVAQSLVPFPQYFGFNTDGALENLGQSTFHALEASLNRRFRNGLNLLVSYTWSKTLTDADSSLPFFATLHGGGSPQNTFDKRGEKALSNQDVPQNLVVSYLYELPTGKNKKFINKGGISNVVFGGWEISGVQRYLSGQPLSFGCATGIPGYGNCIRYDRVPGQNFSSGRKINAAAPAGSPDNQYFNFAAFSDPNNPARIQTGGGYRFGNLPRTTGEIRSYKYANEDLNINKRVHFTERSDMLLQATFLDVFNRHVFDRPDTSGINNPGTFGYTNPAALINGPRSVQFLLKIEF